MNTNLKGAFVKIKPEENIKYQYLFTHFDYFANYINFAFDHLTPEIWVNSEAKPTHAFFYTRPAYILLGDPDVLDITSIFGMMLEDSWIVPSSEKWDRHLTSYFGEKLDTHVRTSFDARSLRLEHLRSLKTGLPAGLRLVPISEAQIKDREGMLYRELQPYFASTDFSQHGAGFCILEGEKVIGFAAANYPIRDNILEVSVRVDYNDDPRHRQKGLGTLLSVALLEYCLEKNLEPQWDAANEISVRLALKLGYTLHEKWKMYHLK